MKNIVISDSLRQTVAENGPSAQRWLHDIEGEFENVVSRWKLDVTGQLLHPGVCSLVFAVTTSTGSSAILKFGVPHDDARGEAAALSLWNGRGATRLLQSAASGFTLLLERCIPGDNLWSLPIDEQIAVASQLLPKLWIPVTESARIRELRESVGEWIERMRNTPQEFRAPAEVIVRAIEWAGELMETQERRLLHGDFNPGNVLRSQGEQDHSSTHICDYTDWVAIDPKPWIGDPAFDIAQLLTNWIAGDMRTDKAVVTDLIRWTNVLAERLDLDPKRVLRWAAVKAIGWNAGYHACATLDHAARIVT